MQPTLCWINLSICRVVLLTIDSARRSNKKQEDNTSQEHWSRWSIAPELHTTNWIRGQTETRPKRSAAQSINEIAKIKSECWAWIRIDPPLHSLNKRHNKIADKTEGNTAAKARLHCCVVPNGRSSRCPRRQFIATSTERDRVEHHHCRFDLTFGYLYLCSGENKRRLWHGRRSLSQVAQLPRKKKRTRKRRAPKEKKGRIEKKHTWPVKIRTVSSKRSALDRHYKMRSSVQHY